MVWIAESEKLHEVRMRVRWQEKRTSGNKLSGNKRGPLRGPMLLRLSVALVQCGLDAVVHVEFNRVSRHAQTRDFFHLQIDVAVDLIVGEHTTCGQEAAVGVKRLELSLIHI